MRSLHLCVFLAATLVGSLSVFGAGDPYKVTASNGAVGDQFGSAVAISGDTVVVGSALEDGVGTNSGAAYVYRWDGAGWVEEAHLIPADTSAAQLFGSAVAISGNTIVVGARFGDGVVTDSGAAYVFTRTGLVWTEQAKLTAADGVLNDEFGGSVAIDSNTIVVGAKNDDDVGSTSGSVYVFRRAAGVWTEQAKLASSDLAPIDQFGRSVGVDGDTIAVGAVTADGVAGSNQGAVYVFVRSAGVWTEQQKLTASDAAASDRLGDSVDLDGDTIIAGAPLRDDGGFISTGAAYVFTRSAGVWAEQAKLTASDLQDGAQVGVSVALDGDTAIAGAVRYDESGMLDQGAAYVFTRLGSTWSEQEKLLAPDGETGDRFGAAMALDDEVAVIGANLDDDAIGNSQGSAYLYERTGVPWGAPPNIEIPFNLVPEEHFGTSVAMDAAHAVIGAAGELGDSVVAGRVLVYARVGDDLLLQDEVTALDGEPGDGFGYSVGVSGDLLLVGAPLDIDGGTLSGAVYEYERSLDSWFISQKIVPADVGFLDRFGFSVSMSPTYAAVGAPSSLFTPGAVYVYTRDLGYHAQQQKLTNPDGSTENQFGSAVSVDGDTLVVGDVESAAAYVFVESGGVWSHEQTLVPADIQSEDDFGVAVSLFGDRVIIGAALHDHLGVDSGAAYVFTRSAGVWSETAKLVAPDGRPGDQFGVSVALDFDNAIVGAALDDDAGVDSGSVYMFRSAGDVWTPVSKLANPEAFPGGDLGRTVAVDGGFALAGAPAQFPSRLGVVYSLRDESGNDPGSDVTNLSSDVTDDLSTSIEAANSDDTLFAQYAAFDQSGQFDLNGKSIDLVSSSEIRQPYNASLVLAEGSSLSSEILRSATFYGSVSVPFGVMATIESERIRFSESASLAIGVSGVLGLESTVSMLETPLSLQFGSAIVGGDLVRLNSEISLADSAISSERETRNDASLTVQSDSQIIGDYTNNGVTTIQNGTLTILGTLTDNGTIIGDFATTRSAPGGFFVDEEYVAGQGASLTLRNGIAKFGAGADIAIDDSTRFDMATSEARMVGLDGSMQSLELMSTDIGADSLGLDRTLAGHFPIGALRIGPTPTTVNLVDAHDNDGLGQGVKEALYVSNLIIDAGATLSTNGCTIYYESLTNDGNVDDPSNLIQIAACIADLTGDGVVDGADLATLLAQWGNPGSADLTGDGNVDGADLAALLAAWGACP